MHQPVILVTGAGQGIGRATARHLATQRHRVALLERDEEAGREAHAECERVGEALFIATNLTGAFLCAKFAAPHLRDRKGAIVNLSSTRRKMSEPNTEAYSASKGGIYALTHALAISLGPDIRVNSISPGWIDVTPWQKESERKPADLSKTDHHQHPAGRVGIPQDIADMVEYLLSDRSAFITGQDFIIDGGMTRKMIYQENQ
ncbi:MAG: SDR family oxidoreductase [Lewinella sp.]